MKMSAATMPTKKAAISSMPSMNQFIGPRGRGSAAAAGSGDPETVGSAMRSPHAGDGSAATPQIERPQPPACALSRRAASIGRLVLLERRLQLLHDGVGIAAGGAHRVGPFLMQGFG